MRPGTKSRHDRWAKRALLVLEKHGEMTVAELMAHPRMKNYPLSQRWLRDLLGDMEVQGFLHYDLTTTKYRLT